jgi:peptide/nickel transport system substrate-binding protein
LKTTGFTKGIVMQKSLLLAGAAALALMVAGQAGAQELKIGLSAEPSAMDPHFHNLTPNNAITKQFFDTLIEQDEEQKIKPRLATSWKALNDTTWEFKLRTDARFTNGDMVTANDIIYSFCRVPKVENSPSSFVVNTRAITGMKAADPATLVVSTATPYPLLLKEMSTIGILSAKANGAGAVEFDRTDCKNAGTYPKTEAFNSGQAAIGSGPYKLVQYTKGDRIVLERNDAYWGPKPDWQRVTLRSITSAGPRVAALLSGDVDLIDNVPIQDLPRVKANSSFKVVEGLSNRIIYLHFDHVGDAPAGVDGAGGKNPYKDKRVREAISKAIDREAIVARIMGGVAVPAGEMLHSSMDGANANMMAAKPDVEGAKKLLAEAGYPDGFSITLHSPNDRYLNDEKVAQAVAQMLSRIGIQTKVEAVPFATYSPRATKLEFSFMLWGWGSGTGEVSSPLRSLVATFDAAKGNGPSNRGRYSNPKVDELLAAALRTVDDAARANLLAQASEAAILGRGSAALQHQQLGDPRRLQLRAAHRRVDLGDGREADQALIQPGSPDRHR